MKTLVNSIDPSFAKCLKNGKYAAPKGTKFIAVHVSSWHMSIFYECYSNIQDVVKAIAQPLIDPMCYSHVKLVWDVEREYLVFYNSMGLVSSAHEFWQENKDNPAAKEAICVGNVKDLFPEDPFKNKDHYCQSDPGETKCYFCGEEIPQRPTEEKPETRVQIPPKPEIEEEEEDEENLGLDPCPQCNEKAWDGYICHFCGLKDI